MDNVLKRSYFISLADSDRIWSYSLSLDETSGLLDRLEEALSTHSFQPDKDFFMDGRREWLFNLLKEITDGKYGHSADNAASAMHYLWEFANCEYCSCASSTLKGVSSETAQDMWFRYAKTDTVCLQEREVLSDMIRRLKNHVKNIAIPPISHP